MHTEHEFTNLRFYIVFHSLAHAFHDLRFFNAEIQDLLLNYTFWSSPQVSTIIDATAVNL